MSDTIKLLTGDEAVARGACDEQVFGGVLAAAVASDDVIQVHRALGRAAVDAAVGVALFDEAGSLA